MYDTIHTKFGREAKDVEELRLKEVSPGVFIGHRRLKESLQRANT